MLYPAVSIPICAFQIGRPHTRPDTSMCLNTSCPVDHSSGLLRFHSVMSFGMTFHLSRHMQIWWLLEEKQIPYTMEKINMRSYGDKPRSFLEKVPSGLLPVIELDGRVYTESMDIMMLLEKVSLSFSMGEHLRCMKPRKSLYLDRTSEVTSTQYHTCATW